MAKRGRPPLLAGKEEEVIEMYLGGSTIGDIQEHFGVSDAPIIRILDAAGVKRRVGRPPSRGNGIRPSKPIPRPAIPDPTVADVRDGRREARYRVPPAGPRVSSAVRDEVFRRDGYRCRLCGSGKRLTVEFAIPEEKGGDARNPKDLRTVCATCLTKPVTDQGKPGLLKRLLGR